MLVQNYDKATASIVLANEEHEHPAGLYLQVKLNFLMGRYLLSYKCVLVLNITGEKLPQIY